MKKLISILFIAIIAAPFGMWLYADSDESKSDENEKFLFENCAIKYLAFSLDTDNSNIVFSPLGMVMCMAMAYHGSDGDTLSEFENAFQIQINDAFAQKQFRTIKDLMRKRPSGSDTEVLISNAVFYDKKIEIFKDYQNLIKQWYSAPFNAHDFSDKSGLVKRVNKQIKENTRNMIPNAFDESEIDEKANLLFLNTVFLKATWTNPFDPDLTKDAPFHLENGSTVEIPMMNISELRADYLRGENYTLLSLTCFPNLTYYTIIMPDNSSELSEFAKKLGGGKLSEMFYAGARNYSLIHKISIPKFKYGNKTQLKSFLEGVGITKSFDKLHSDFSKISKTRLWIDDVFSKTIIEVDEKGISAASAHKVSAMSASRDNVPEFIANKPFIYVIHDYNTRAILFMGVYRGVSE